MAEPEWIASTLAHVYTFPPSFHVERDRDVWIIDGLRVSVKGGILPWGVRTMVDPIL